MTVSVPENESQRLQWLRECAILDTLPEKDFDDAVQLAARLCRVPTAVISLIDQDRQWTKAAVGQDKTEHRRHVSFGARAIFASDLLEVPDAHADARFAENPLVTGEPFVRFYAGAPRRLTDEEAALLEAAVLRLLARQLAGRVELMRHVALQNALIADRLCLCLTAAQCRFGSKTLARAFRSVTCRKRLCGAATARQALSATAFR